MKLKYDELLSNFAINCNLRHYTLACTSSRQLAGMASTGAVHKVGRRSLRAPGFTLLGFNA